MVADMFVSRHLGLAAVAWLCAVATVGCDRSSEGAAAEPASTPTTGGPHGAAAGPAGGPEEPSEQRLTFAEALATAQSQYPDAHAIEVELETEEGRELLEVEFLVDAEVREVYMDPITGEVVREETEALDEAERATLPKLAEVLDAGEVNLADAIELALEQYDEEDVREIELEVHGDEVILEVEVRQADGSMVAWVLDPRSGEVRGQETDERSHPVEPDAPGE